MKRWKRHTIVLAATLLAFIVATLGNLSYAADETKENKEAAQASAVSETQNKTTEEAASNTQPPTQAPTTDAVSETEQTTEASSTEQLVPEQSDPSSVTAAGSTSTGRSTEKTKKTVSDENSGILIEGSNLYAQGTPIVIKKDSDGKAYVFDSKGQTRLSETPVTSGFSIYGGGKNKTVKSNVSIVIQNVQVSSVYGGGYSDGTGPADVTGNVSITISGTVNASKVYGGGYAMASKGSASANVSGSVTVDIPSVPSGNHGNLYGGGYAYTTNSYSASANTGSVSFSVTGRTYSLRGGGSATSKDSGSATADVSGSISCTLKNVDIREVYAGGYADGAKARAKAGSTTTAFQGQGNEVMIFQGAGNASNSACADVTGSVSAVMSGCSNIYGYVTSGGTSYSGGSADVYGSVSLTVTGSVSPVDEQWGNLVAAAFNGGGSANGSGSHADVKGSSSVTMKDSSIVGTIIGGGGSSQGGSAKVTQTSISLSNVKGCEYKGTMYYGDYIAGGETDDADAKDLAASEKSTVTVSESKVEFLWGGLLMKGESLSSNTDSELILKDNTSSFDGIANFNTLNIKHTLNLSSFEPKSQTKPTALKTSGLDVGDIAVAFNGSGAKENWFTLKNGKLKYQSDSESATWNIASFGTASGSINVDKTPEVPDMTIENNIADELLTEEDSQKIADGSTVEIILKSEPVSSPSKKIEDLLNKELKRTSAQQAMLLDINLLKVTDGTEEKIPTVGTPLMLTFDVPEEYQREGREYLVIRLHQREDGTYETDTLKDLNPDPDKVTIETDRFSIYSLDYKDTQDSSDTTTEQNTENSSTGENMTTSKQKQTSIGRRSTSSKATVSKKETSAPEHSNAVSYKKTASTGDHRDDLSSLFMVLSGSLICSGVLLTRRLKR